MPKYTALIYSVEEQDTTPEEWAALKEEYDEFSARAGAAGVIAGGEALEDTSTATTVHVDGKGGEIHTTDGPYAETKEALGGFYLLDCEDLDEAIRWAAQIPGAWSGHVEVRPVIDFDQGG